jgi:hypothetical protein
MGYFYNFSLAILLFLSAQSPSHADFRKFATKDFDLANPQEVFTLDAIDDGLTPGRARFYSLVFNNLDNGVVLTMMRRENVTPENRLALGFANKRLDRRNNISIVSPNNHSVHTLRVKNKLARRDQLTTLKLRQFVIDPQNNTKVVFLKENNIRVNVITPQEVCAQTLTCARLDFGDTSIFKLYPNSCIGGGVPVELNQCGN